ncbi:MAG: hypothetical protein ACOC56_02065 [Atribacterota bacterium]
MGQPTYKFRAGNISVAVFENEAKDEQGNVRKDDNGNTVTFESVVLQRGYKDKNNEWTNETLNLRKNDIQKASLCLQEALRNVFQTKSE